MMRNVSVIRLLNARAAVVSASAQSQQPKKFLSTKQQQQREDLLNEQERFNTYPAESGFVKSSPYDHIVIPNLTLDQFVWNNFREWENKIATVSGNYLHLINV